MFDPKSNLRISVLQLDVGPRCPVSWLLHKMLGIKSICLLPPPEGKLPTETGGLGMAGQRVAVHFSPGLADDGFLVFTRIPITPCGRGLTPQLARPVGRLPAWCLVSAAFLLRALRVERRQLVHVPLLY